MSQLFGSDITLPRDPTAPLHAASKQYVDAGLDTKSDTLHTHDLSQLGAASIDTLGTLFSRFFDIVTPLYTEQMTPFYHWNETPINVTGSAAFMKYGEFIPVENTCFGTGSAIFVTSPGSLLISRNGYHEGFFPTSVLGSSALDGLRSVFGAPRTVKQLHDGSMMFLTHQINNGYFFECIQVDTTISVIKWSSLTSNYFYFDVVQSEADPSKVLLFGCDSTGAAIYRLTNLASNTKVSVSN